MNYRHLDEMTGHGFRAMAATLLNEMGLWHPDATDDDQVAAADASGWLAQPRPTMMAMAVYRSACGERADEPTPPSTLRHVQQQEPRRTFWCVEALGPSLATAISSMCQHRPRLPGFMATQVERINRLRAEGCHVLAYQGQAVVQRQRHHVAGLALRI